MEDTLTRLALNIDKSSWELVKFGDVAFEPKETCNDIIKEGIEHVVGLEHITTGDIRLRNSATIEESTTFSKKFQAGDVLFGRRRSYLKKAAQASFGGICSGDITVFRAKKNLLPALLPFIVSNDKFFDYAIKHSAGGLSPRVKFKDLANYQFLLPPKEEQAQLAELLWAIDEVIEKAAQNLMSQDTLSKSILNQIFFGKECKNVKLSELASQEKYSCIGGPFGSNLTSKHYVSEAGIPVIRGINFSQGLNSFSEEGFVFVSEETAKSLQRNMAFRGDIVITQRGTLGQVALIPKSSQFEKYIISQSQMKLTVDENKVDSYFLYNYFKSDFGQNQIKNSVIATGVPHINLEIFRSYQIPVPDLKYQRLMVDKIRTIQENIFKIEKYIKDSKSLQKSLINQIF